MVLARVGLLLFIIVLSFRDSYQFLAKIKSFKGNKTDSYNGILFLWPVNKLELYKSFQELTPISSMVILTNGDIVIGSKTGEIRIYDQYTTTLKTTLTGHNQPVTALLELTHEELASGSQDGIIKIWNIKDGSCKLTLSQHSSKVSSLVLLVNGDLVSGSSDRTIIFWDRNLGTAKKVLEPLSESVVSMVTLKTGELAVGLNDNLIQVYKIKNPEKIKLLYSLTGHFGAVTSLVAHPNGNLISGSQDGMVKIWKGKKQIDSLSESDNLPIHSMTLLPIGNLACGHSQGKIKIWNLESGKLKQAVEHDKNSTVIFLGLSPDKFKLISAGDFPLVNIWTPTGRRIK